MSMLIAKGTFAVRAPSGGPGRFLPSPAFPEIANPRPAFAGMAYIARPRIDRTLYDRRTQ